MSNMKIIIEDMEKKINFYKNFGNDKQKYLLKFLKERNFYEKIIKTDKKEIESKLKRIKRKK